MRSSGNKKKVLLVTVVLLLLAPVAYVLVSHFAQENTSAAASENVAAESVDAEIEKAKQMAEQEPSDVHYISLSLLLINNQRFAEGVAACKKALDLNPKSIVAYNNLGFAQLMLKRYDESEKSLKEALAINPDFELAKNNLNLLKVEKEKVLASINALKDTIQVSPTFERYYLLGFQYYSIGLYDQSRLAYLLALKFEDKSAETHNNLCACYNALGKWSDAVKSCKRALELKPDFGLANNNLHVAEDALLAK
jgi:protein O-mannosyl-transferase